MQKEKEEQLQRVDAICQHPLWQTSRKRIEELEQDRVFCGHDVIHFLDVARLAYLFNLEENLKLEKEEIYTAALLHDVGRFVQYENGTPHQLASLPLAEKLMERHGYTEEEKARILRAIENHRNREIRDEKSLTGILYRADKMSRSCFGCKAEKECDWSAEKKNLIIEY